jgi:hypothetical protein
MVVLAIAAVGGYFLDQYFGWGLDQYLVGFVS